MFPALPNSHVPYGTGSYGLDPDSLRNQLANGMPLRAGAYMAVSDLQSVLNDANLDAVFMDIPFVEVWGWDAESSRTSARTTPNRVDTVTRLEGTLLERILTKLAEAPGLPCRIPGALLLGGNIGHWVYMQWDLDPVEGTLQAKVIDSMEAANEKIENLQNILGRVGHRLEERLAPLRVSCRFTDDIEVICTGRQTDDHTCGIRVLKEVFENSHEIGAIDQSHTPVAYTYYQQLHQAGDDTQRLKEALYNDLWGFDTGAIASGAGASQNARVESADADLEEAIRLSALAAQEREDADFARRLAQENPFGVLEMSTPDTSSDEALARLLAADFNYA